MGLPIRPMTLADLEVADAIALAAYNTPLSRAVEIRRYLELQPDGWFLVVEDDQAVGMGGAVDYGSFAYIGLIAVLPQAQRRGIGQAIMTHILAWLTTREIPMVLLDASQAGAPLYKKLGFVVDDESEIWQLADPSQLVLQMKHATHWPTMTPPIFTPTVAQPYKLWYVSLHIVP